MPSIDILLPTRNDNDIGLIRTLETVYQSLYRPLRVILINDSSKRLPELPENIDAELLIINTPSRSGLTQALKFAEKEINAKYIARVDVGDIVHTERFKTQVEFMEENLRVGVVGCVTKLFIRDGSQISPCGLSSDSQSVKADLIYTNPLVHGSILMRSSVFFDVGGYDTNAMVAQDLDLYLRLRSLCDFAILDYPEHQHFFNTGSSITLNNNKRSVYYSLRARLSYLPFLDKIKAAFLLGVFRDIVILMLPLDILRKIRLYRLKSKSNVSAITKN